jgi:hypothetical protein
MCASRRTKRRFSLQRNQSPQRSEREGYRGRARPRVERTMFASKAELKTKGLVLGNGPLLHWAFMKFRGPKALNDKLAVIRTYSGVDVVVFPDG